MAWQALQAGVGWLVHWLFGAPDDLCARLSCCMSPPSCPVLCQVGLLYVVLLPSAVLHYVYCRPKPLLETVGNHASHLILQRGPTRVVASWLYCGGVNQHPAACRPILLLRPSASP